MTDEDRQAIIRGTEPVAPPRRQLLNQPDCRSQFVHFVESGTISILSDHQGVPGAELFVVGFEGMLGTSLLHGDDRTSTFSQVDEAGSAYRLSAVTFRELVRDRPACHSTLLKFARVQSLQLEAGASASLHSTIDQRLARRLLMALDRSDRRNFSVTHDDLARLLAIRQPTITNALHRLEGEQLIR